jgi:hypothetical protein
MIYTRYTAALFTDFNFFSDVSGNKASVVIKDGTTGTNYTASNTFAMSTGFWYHVAFSYETINKNVTVFVNGYPGTAVSLPNPPRYTSAIPITIGGNDGVSNHNLYIRDLRVVQGGVVPVATFTPGAAPFSYASPGYVANMGTTVFTLLGQFVTYNPTGKYNTSLVLNNNPALNGSNVYSVYPVLLNSTNTFSVSFWTKVTTLKPNGLNYAVMVGFRGTPVSNASATNYFDLFQNANNGSLGFYGQNGDIIPSSYQPFIGSSTTPAVGTWYHMAWVVNSTNFTLYVNGVQTGATPVVGNAFTVTNMYLATTSQYLSGQSFSGELDDLLIYNTALTSTQVQSVYSSQGAPAPSRAMPLPKLAWDFNGTTAPYIGTVSSTAVNGSITYGTGKYAQDIIMNGTSNIVYNIYDQIVLDTGFTIAFWLKPLNVTTAGWIYDISATNFGDRLYASIQTNGYLSFVYLGFAFYSPYPLSVGTWYHITVTLVAGMMTLYWNGTYSAQSAQSTTGVILANKLSIAALVGGQGPNINAEYDDLRIFDRALTSAQVQSIYNQQGVPGRGVQTKSPIQPGYVYAPLHNSTIIGTSSPWVVNSQNPDPTTSGITGTDNWNTDPNRTNLWSLAPFKYFIFLSRNAYPLNNIPVEGLRYPVLISVTGTYQLSLLVCTGGGNSDSLFWNFDNDAPVNQGGFSVPESFGTWYSFAGVTLTAGSHTLSLQMREPVGIGAIKLSSTIYPGTYYNVTPISLTGTPLFTQLSPSATNSAVGAFSLRAVNGTSARAVQVRPVAAFPPTGFTSAVTNPGGNQYNQTLTGYAFGGSGVYTSNCSSWAFSDGNIPGPWKAFDYNTGTWWETNYAAGPVYNAIGATASSNAYNGSYTTTVSGSSIGGEWLQLGIPTAIVLYSYSMYQRSGFSGSRMPYQWVVAGSNDGTTWTTVDVETGITWTSATQTFTTTSTTPYLYFRLIVQAIQTGGYTGQPVNIGQWTLNGTPSSTTTDFYADRLGNLLTAPVVGQSLANWLGGATGYVTTWYDQSGAGNHATQTTAANQPIIQRATKGQGYATVWPGLTSTRLVYGTSSNLFDSTNYSICVNAKRTVAVSTTTYYAGTNGQPVTNQNLGVGYSNDTTLRLSEWGYSLNAPTVSAYAGVSEPLGYDFFTFSQTSGMRNYTWRSGTYASNANTGLTTPLSRSGNSTIGGTNDSASFTGEIYELLVFTQSLYDLDNTGGLITQVYQNQLSAYGT